MSLVISISDTQVSNSVYAPLDLSRNSIRLLRVLPELSSQGHVRCEVRKATSYSFYTCVSYVWGPPDGGFHIQLNNELHVVRDNLCCFLHEARKKNFGWLWIDALCIDQTNIAERTHQVQQIGEIFHQATRVISWLGRDDYTGIAEFLRLAAHGSGNYNNSTAFAKHKYWTRAWVTQEILLAREVVLMARDVELPIGRLPAFTSGFNFVLRLRLNPKIMAGVRTDIKNLIFLLDQFSDQQCHVLRDRVFSLLALSGNAATIKVDYGVSEQEIAWRVLDLYRHCFCLCSLYVVSRALSRDSEAPLPDLSPRTSPRSVHIKLRLEHLNVRNRHVRLHMFGSDRLLDHINPLVWNALRQERHGTLSQGSIKSIFIDLRLLCRNFRNPVHFEYSKHLALYHDPDQSGFQYQVVEKSRSDKHVPRDTQYWPEPLLLTCDDLGSVTLHLSAAFWVQVTTILRWYTIDGTRCCKRAKGEECRSIEHGNFEFARDV